MKRLAFLALVVLTACAPARPAASRAALTGKDGPKTIAGTEIVNRYTALSVSAMTNDTSITVVDPTGITAGDLILLVSAQGAAIDTSNTASYGAITDLGNAGRHELWIVSSVAGAVLSLDLGCSPTGVQHDYLLSTRPQVVRVPQYTTLNVPVGTTLTGAPWNGTTGGVVAVHVESTATVAGLIDGNGLGFRGGAVSATTATFASVVNGYVDALALGGEKGEGVAGDQVVYDGALFNGRYGRGAPANGGGGGNGYLGGGGGGAGADASATGYTGQGTMTPASAAWALDPNVAGAGFPGGGRGGYTLSGLDLDALAIGPDVPAWAGNGRAQQGGLGGHPLVAASRIFFGGGGGAGNFDGTVPAVPTGARGGGVVYLMAQTVTGAGTIRADGETGRDGTLVGNNAASVGTGGGGGGGGGGGMVLLRATGNPTLTVSARGGRGGNLAVGGTFASGLAGASGPGGGGAGGGVALASGLTLTTTPLVTGGLGGTTAAPALTEFPSNGATSGDVGVNVTGVSQAAAPVACLPANLSVTLADSADPVDTSAGYSYTASITNAGPNASYDVVVTITLPAGVTAGAVTANAAWTCMQVAQVLTCTRALMLSGSASNISIAVTAPSAPGTITASASVASRDDPAAANNSTSENTLIQFPRADLTLTKTGPAATASGESYSYTLAVHNNGPRTAPSLSVTDTLPAGVSFVSASGAGWTCTPSGGVVTCTFGSLANGGDASVDLLVTAPALTSTTSATNNAVVAVTSATTVDPTAGNNNGSVTTAITPVNLSITKVDALDPVPASGSINYTLTVSNPATVSAHAIVVDDPLPAGTAFVNASGTGWTCALVVTTVHCTRATIAAMSTAAITVILTAPASPGLLANTATVNSTATDPSLANNTATEQTTISPPAPGSADLSIAISDAPDPVDINATLSYTVTVSNAGPDPADGVQLIGSLPAGAAFVSATGSGWTCAAAGTTVTCSQSGSLTMGAAPPITIVVTAPGAPATVTASVVITATTPDPAVGNNAAVATTEVIDPTVLNQVPTLSLPAMLSTLEDTALVLAGSMAPKVGDTDAATDELELHVSISGGVLSLATLAGLDFATGDGVLDPELVVRGSLAALNAALDGSTFTPVPNFSGAATLSFTLDDLGHNGAGGPKEVSALLPVTVIPVDDPPRAGDDELTLTIDAGATLIDVLANDSAGDVEQALHVSTVSMPEHGFAALSASGDAILYTPARDFLGDDHFTYSASDGTSLASANVTVHVVAAPAPTEITLVGGGIGCSLSARSYAPRSGALFAVGLLLLALALRRRAAR